MTDPKERVKKFENRMLRRIFGPKREEDNKGLEKRARWGASWLLNKYSYEGLWDMTPCNLVHYRAWKQEVDNNVTFLGVLAQWGRSRRVETKINALQVRPFRLYSHLTGLLDAHLLQAKLWHCRQATSIVKRIVRFSLTACTHDTKNVSFERRRYYLSYHAF